VHLLIALLEAADTSDRTLAHLSAAGVREPWILRARSAAAVLSADVPVFSGLRSLAFGTDEDRLVVLALIDLPTQEEVSALLLRVQAELDKERPSAGRAFALPLVSPAGR